MPVNPPPADLPASDLSDLRRARAYLVRVAEPPALALSAFIDAHGPVDAARRVQARQVPEPVALETGARHRLDLADADIAAAARVGARLVIPEDEEWPTHLIAALTRTATATGASWAAPPIALWVQSEMPLRDALTNAVSVIGARAATGYGETIAADIGYGLATTGVTVLSGLAYGIDAASHRGTLAARGLTTAVLATGITQCYPTGNKNLLDDIRAAGVIVTEYPPDTPPARHRVLVRNRLVAALSLGTVVVEAGLRSGSLHTARRAQDLSRPVMAVPGPITSAQSTGCHHLISEHAATLVTSVDDIHTTLDSPRPRPA